MLAEEVTANAYEGWFYGHSSLDEDNKDVSGGSTMHL